jgi:hypothetical protein
MPDAISGAIQRGLAATREGKPALLEMMTKEEEDVCSYWR